MTPDRFTVPTADQAFQHAARLLVEAEACLDNPNRSDAVVTVARGWTELGDSLIHHADPDCS